MPCDGEVTIHCEFCPYKIKCEKYKENNDGSKETT